MHLDEPRNAILWGPYLFLIKVNVYITGRVAIGLLFRPSVWVVGVDVFVSYCLLLVIYIDMFSIVSFRVLYNWDIEIQ